VDWDKWVDEDDEEEGAADPTSQFDLSNLSDFSNFEEGGAGAGALAGGTTPGDHSDSDDEDLPDLEKA
jgi:hypothetical protein